MAYKRPKIFLSATMLLLSGLLLSAQPARSEPVALNDRSMDQVTAGNTKEGGGLIVGSSSEAVDSRTRRLDLSGEAQQGAKGFNIVNSAESAVANTTNIWDGTAVTITVEDGDSKPVLEVNQTNQVTQEQVRSATMSGYTRSEAEQTEILNRSISESYLNKVVNVNDTTNISEKIRSSTITSTAVVNTLLKFNLSDKLSFSGHLGQGMAGAGHTDVTFEGGSADIAVAVDKGEVTASSDGSLVAKGGLILVTRVVLPKVKVVIDGAGCGVVMGSCNASSTLTEFTYKKTDNSTLEIIENHQSGQSSFSEVKTSIYRSPFELKSAKAEYIVIDDSTLKLDSDVTLELSESAQKEIEGMNIVNAVGSNVANSVNISRTEKFKSRRSTLVLNQLNIVHHGR
jgi:uncharacterized protein YsxB (DUF464 family)